MSESAEEGPAPDPAVLEAMLRGVMEPQAAAIQALAGVHAAWYQAWQAAGFSEERAYGLVQIMVRQAFGGR